jgi:hypothetical protein
MLARVEKATALRPPVRLRPDGAARLVGVEIEIAGLGALAAAMLLRELRGGRMIELDPYRFDLVGTALGDVWRVRRDVRSATGEVAGRDGTMKMPAWAVSGKPVVAGASFRLSRAPQRWLGRGRPVVGATGRPGGDSSRH